MSADGGFSEVEYSLAEGHAVLGDDFDYRTDIDKRLAGDKAFRADLRAKTPSLLHRKLKDQMTA